MPSDTADAIREFVSRFDFDWSDLYRGESVRPVTLEAHVADLRQLISVRDAYDQLGFALFCELSNAHPTPYLKLEAENDLAGSAYVVFGGYYRQGFQLLRTWLELSVVGVYWGETEYSRVASEYQRWLNGRHNTPHWHKTLDKVCGADQWRDPHSLAGKLDALREHLSDYTHLRNLRIRNTQEGRDNVPRYLPEVFERWRQCMTDGTAGICKLWMNSYAHVLADYFRTNDPSGTTMALAAVDAEAQDQFRVMLESRSASP